MASVNRYKMFWMITLTLATSSSSGGRKGDMVKVLWADRDGMNLYIKRLEEGHFVRPSAQDGKISLTRSQLALLLERFDWRQPVRQKCTNPLSML